MRKTILLAAAFLLAALPSAYAACESPDELVIDTTKIANRKIDVDKVTAAARALASESVMVRVRVYDTLHGSADINALADKDIRQCGWTLSDGSRKTNLLFIPLAVQDGDITVATGRATNARISEPMANVAIKTLMTPRWQTYKKDPAALTNGLVDMLVSFKAELAKPLSGGGNMTIVHSEPGDYSWIWKTFLVICGCGLLGGGTIVFLRTRSDSGDKQGTAAETKRIRADCRDRLMNLNDDVLVLQAKVGRASGTAQSQLAEDMVSYKRHVEAGLSEFRRFDNPDREPDQGSLPVSVLLANQQRYADITVQHIEPAEKLREKIESAFAGSTTEKMPA